MKEAFHRREQVSRTLEYAYDDFAVAVLARALGRRDVADAFTKRAANWRNVFDRSVGFVRGRHADGRWVESFDPAAEQPWITEGTPWHYTFFVPHDVAGLIEAMGGREAFVARLDRLFAEGRYWHGNEPSHHIAYLYDHAGAPWRTQRRCAGSWPASTASAPRDSRATTTPARCRPGTSSRRSASTPSPPGRPTTRSAAPSSRRRGVDVGGGRKIHHPGAGSVGREPLRPVGDPRRPAARAALDRPRGRGPGRNAGAADGPAPEPELGREARGRPAVALHDPVKGEVTERDAGATPRRAPPAGAP